MHNKHSTLYSAFSESFRIHRCSENYSVITLIALIFSLSFRQVLPPYAAVSDTTHTSHHITYSHITHTCTHTHTHHITSHTHTSHTHTSHHITYSHITHTHITSHHIHITHTHITSHHILTHHTHTHHITYSQTSHHITYSHITHTHHITYSQTSHALTHAQLYLQPQSSFLQEYSGHIVDVFESVSIHQYTTIPTCMYNHIHVCSVCKNPPTCTYICHSVCICEHSPSTDHNHCIPHVHHLQV